MSEKLWPRDASLFARGEYQNVENSFLEVHRLHLFKMASMECIRALLPVPRTLECRRRNAEFYESHYPYIIDFCSTHLGTFSCITLISPLSFSRRRYCRFHASLLCNCVLLLPPVEEPFTVHLETSPERATMLAFTRSV